MYHTVLVSLKSSDMMFSLEREMVYLYMKKRSEDTAYSALTEERIAKIVAMQVEKKLHRYPFSLSSLNAKSA